MEAECPRQIAMEKEFRVLLPTNGLIMASNDDDETGNLQRQLPFRDECFGGYEIWGPVAEWTNAQLFNLGSWV